MVRINGIRVVLAWLIAGPACALAPHELAVLVNRDSPDSRYVANTYCAMRGIPQRNLVLVSVPESALQPEARITPQGFTDSIWEPVSTILDQRGLTPTIRAWVYSVDFPTRVTTRPEMSLQGMTLVRNLPPPEGAIKGGSFVSPFFAGPSQVAGARRPTVGLDAWRIDDAPMASMMLGHTGARGSSVDQVLAGLRRGMASDYTHPTGTVFFVETEDVRSRARAWQYPDAIRELTELGVHATAGPGFPGNDATVLGVLTGTPQLNPFRKYTVLPGAFGEHLTSFGACFEQQSQTKLTAWLRAGFTGSAGTVVEPFALWAKFPHARFFVHYAHGAAMIDSLFQSVRCPLQLLLVGEPLARPFAPRIDVELAVTDLPDGATRLQAAATLPPDTAPPRLTVLVDDHAVVTNSEALEVVLPEDSAMEGVRRIRAIVRTAGSVGHVGWTEREHRVGGRQLMLSPPAGGTNISLTALTTLAVSAPPGATDVSLLRGTEVLATTGGNADMLELDPGRVGRGPFRVHAQARYPDGGVVASPSIWLQGVRPKPPGLTAIRTTTDDDGAVRLDPEWGEAPTTGTTWTWYQASEGLTSAAPPELLGMGMLTRTNGSYALVPDRQQGEPVLALPALMTRHRIRPTEIAARIRLLPGASAPGPHRLGGLAFNVRGQESFDVFGYHLTRNAWVLGRWRDGAWTFASRRGRPFPRGRPVELRVREEAGRIRGMVDGETVCTWPDGGFDKGRPWGIVTTALEVRFQDLWVSPPILDGAGWQEHDGGGRIRRPARATGARLVLRADNGFTSRIQRTELSGVPSAP